MNVVTSDYAGMVSRRDGWVPIGMTNYSPEQLEAVQHAVERVGANWDGADDTTVKAELYKALDEAEVDLEGEDVAALAEAIEASDGVVSVQAVLGGR